tara:strand:- start:5630 stop:8677 length:3048 start_codon:yes stop_codon:yes gene_type:complete
MAYGVFKTATIKGEKGTDWLIHIHKKNYSGSSSELNLFGEGFEIKWSGEGGTRNRQYLTSECVLKTFIESDPDESFLYDIFTKGDKEYFIRIYKGVTSADSDYIWWYGWVQPSFDKFSNEPYPYTANIIATDSIGVFKERADDVLNSATWNKAYRINNHIADFGTTMALFDHSGSDLAPIPQNVKWFKTSVDWFRNGDTYQANDPFYSYYTTRAAYRKDVENKPLNYKKYDVLTGALKTFNTVGFLSDGAYYFIQPNNKVATSGNVRIYPYIGTDNEVPSGASIGDESTLLAIDQSTNVILGGSTITFDPVLKSVSCDFINGESSFTVPFDSDLTTPFTAGLLQGDVLEGGSLRIYFRAKHREVFNTNQINFPTSSYTLVNAGHQTTFSLQIKIGTGSGVRYLQEGAGTLEWRTDTNPVTITLVRGRGANTGGSLLNNGSGDYLTALSIKNNDDFGEDLSLDGVDAHPCRIEDNGSGVFTAITELRFAGDFPIPVVSGELTIQLTAVNTYTPYLFSAGGFAGVISSVNYANQTPSTVTRTTLSGLGGEYPNISLVGTDTVALNSDAIGLTFTSTQTDTEAFEDLDLGRISVGQTTSGLALFQDSIFSVQYNTGTDADPIMFAATEGFRADDSGSYVNILQLLTNQFLELQTEPLEILQARIQSTNISPLKNIRYAINGDTNYKYYQFLGGTFYAQSEIMEGEWFKVNVGSPTNSPDTPIALRSSNQPVFDTTFTNILGNTKKIVNNLTQNQYGDLQVALPNGTAVTTITLNQNTRGKIYNGQKILLSESDGSNPVTLTASGDVNLGVKQIPINSFTPSVDYAINSKVSPLTYDLSNVITGGGGSTTQTVNIILKDVGSYLWYAFSQNNWYTLGSATFPTLGTGSSPSALASFSSHYQGRMTSYTAIENCTLKKFILTFNWSSSAINGDVDLEFAFSKFTPITNGTAASISMNSITATNTTGTFTENKPYQVEFTLSGSNASLSAGDCLACHIRSVNSSTSNRVFVYGTAILKVEI